MKQLSKDLKDLNSEATCFSQTNLLYMKNFYCLYQSYAEITPQVEEQHDGCTITPQVEEQIKFDIFSIPWGHHKVLIDKCKNNPQKALFFVHQTIVNGWSRNMLLNFLHTDLGDIKVKGEVFEPFSQTENVSTSCPLTLPLTFIKN